MALVEVRFNASHAQFIATSRKLSASGLLVPQNRVLCHLDYSQRMLLFHLLAVTYLAEVLEFSVAIRANGLYRFDTRGDCKESPERLLCVVPLPKEICLELSLCISFPLATWLLWVYLDP